MMAVWRRRERKGELGMGRSIGLAGLIGPMGLMGPMGLDDSRSRSGSAAEAPPDLMRPIRPIRPIPSHSAASNTTTVGSKALSLVSAADR